VSLRRITEGRARHPERSRGARHAACQEGARVAPLIAADRSPRQKCSIRADARSRSARGLRTAPRTPQQMRCSRSAGPGPLPAPRKNHRGVPGPAALPTVGGRPSRSASLGPHVARSSSAPLHATCAPVMRRGRRPAIRATNRAGRPLHSSRCRLAARFARRLTGPRSHQRGAWAWSPVPPLRGFRIVAPRRSALIPGPRSAGAGRATTAPSRARNSNTCPRAHLGAGGAGPGAQTNTAPCQRPKKRLQHSHSGAGNESAATGRKHRRRADHPGDGPTGKPPRGVGPRSNPPPRSPCHAGP